MMQWRRRCSYEVKARSQRGTLVPKVTASSEVARLQWHWARDGCGALCQRFHLSPSRFSPLFFSVSGGYEGCFACTSPSSAVCIYDASSNGGEQDKGERNG